MRKLREELSALKAFKDRKEVVEAELERLQQVASLPYYQVNQ